MALKGDEHNDVTKIAFGVVGFVFAFFIGFCVSAMWSQINSADAGEIRTSPEPLRDVIRVVGADPATWLESVHAR